MDLCKRCGRFLCGECVQLVEEDAYCNDCVGKLEGPPSMWANACVAASIVTWIALVLTARLPGPAFPFIGALVLAFATCVMSSIEFIRIGRRLASRRGGRRASVAMIAGALPFLLLAAAAIYGIKHGA